mgnify:FL=1
MMTILYILIAIFLPPVAAFMLVGVSKHFWLNILLTLLGGLPGSVHALWLLARHR